MSFEKLLQKVDKNKYPINVSGIVNTAKAYLFSDLFLYKKDKSILFVTYNDLQARALYKDFRQLVGEKVLYFPAKEIVLYNVVAKSQEIELKRLQVVKELIKDNKPKIVITTLEALMQKMPSMKSFGERAFKLKVGDTITQNDLINKLILSGYQRDEIVDGSGQFCVRGGIIDFCELQSDTGYRVELFGDDIDSIRLFDITTQRTAKMLNEVEVFPCSESIEQVDKMVLLHDIMDEAILCFDEPLRAREIAITTYNEFLNSYTNLLEKGKANKEAISLLINPDEIINDFDNRNLINLTLLENRDTDIVIKTRDINESENINELIKSIVDYNKKGYNTKIFSGNKKITQNFTKELLDQEVDLTKNTIITGNLSGSFEFPEGKIAVISENRIFGQDKKTVKKIRNKTKIDFNDFTVGDYVVHRFHGIGRYVGTHTLNIEGALRDYFKIEYKDNSMLYVPTSQLDLVEKYIGSEGKEPKLSKMGGTEWTNTKAKVKSALMDIANELIEIYSKRQASQGYAFSQDTVWQKDFEDRFPYVETDDQLRCIEEVKRDMESSKIMDRLLCGDVGFGKTEVALRAAFKAVMDGKQVAYLVPTTVLANQQFNTFVDRMRGFPIKVEMLSRYRSVANKEKIIKELNLGSIDVVIGTHSIIQKSVKFKDLGLLIIDEEQKFGVTHKEKLKQLYPNVDVLTLTATPIPRTLHMSMVNIRDMSVIYEPPENRHPIVTRVMEYDKDVVRDAIIKEISRGGQVFYVHNKVRSLDRIAYELSQLVPEAEILVGHGQMDTKYLESVMLKFIEGKANVLVCTTIIESGVDIPNANTMIVDDADKMGLAGLYQLKGRIGRSNRIASAYLMYRKDKILTEIAEKRLKAISDFTEFGAGFKIAMRDLQIRGAGNLLGSQQHGHMEAVGYDTYCRLLDEAVRELKGEPVKPNNDVQIDIAVSAYISEEYIPNELQRIEAYKKIAGAESDEDIINIKDELIDRNGDIPKEVENLFKITELKILARKLAINSIKETSNGTVIHFDPKEIDMNRIIKMGSDYKGRIFFNNGKSPFLTYKDNAKKEKLVDNIKELMWRSLC